MIFFAEIDPVWMFLAGCALLTFILLRRSYRHFGKRRQSSSAPIERQHRPTGKWDGAQRDALAQIERQKVEMHEMSRELNGQLNSKILVLENLISQSQRQIERMEQLLEQNESVR
ncbi:MAG: hypothetical protein MI725_08970 [Pirellulales bacterium]|nr:hypothetical protein [Pirellulales bacterium]